MVGRRGLPQPLPRMGKSKQLRLCKEREVEGAHPVGQGPGDTGRGHPSRSPGASGHTDNWRAGDGSPSCSLEMILRMLVDRLPEGKGDFLEAVGAPLGTTKPPLS